MPGNAVGLNRWVPQSGVVVEPRCYCSRQRLWRLNSPADGAAVHVPGAIDRLGRRHRVEPRISAHDAPSLQHALGSMAQEHDYPEIQGGGSLILAWQIRNKRVLVVGGGEVAAGRIVNVLNADAKVTVVSPRDGLNPEVAYRIEQKQVDYVDRKFEPSDLDGADMVLTAVDDPEASTQIWKLCKERRIAANIADVPPECDFYFGSVHRDGPLQIMVSTNGKGPRLANIVRRQVAANLPPNIGQAITRVGMLRKKLRQVAPDISEGPKRMAWMIKVSDSYSLEDLCSISDSEMEQLLGYYKPNTVPSLDLLRLQEPDVVQASDCNATSSRFTHARVPVTSNTLQNLFAVSERPLQYNMDLAQRPPYSTVDFKALAKADQDFKRTWQACSGKLDFQDPAILQALSKAILKVDFDIELSLPDDRLCPPIPNRWNYVSWLQGLLDSTSPSYSNKYESEREVLGLDIGTGASGIYAMLCMKSRPNWTMCATDIDKTSFESAAANFAENNLLSRSRMLHTTSSMPLVPIEALGTQQLDFTVCNPPFFADSAEMEKSLSGEGKATGPNAICTGSNNEMICPGGDLGFVSRIVEESLLLRDKVTWYTSMLGKLSSAKAIVELLKSNKISNWAVGVLDPGTKTGTKRWVVAWSFGDLRPRNSIARPPGGSFPHDLLPFPTSYNVSLPSSLMGSAACDKVNDQLSALDLGWKWNATTSSGVGEASDNVWGRAYRRSYERRKREGLVEMPGDALNRKTKLAFRVTVVQLAGEITLEWLKGDDQVLEQTEAAGTRLNLTSPAISLSSPPSAELYDYSLLLHTVFQSSKPLSLAHYYWSNTLAIGLNNNMAYEDQPVFYATSTELADLGAARFDHDTAAVGDKDYALTGHSHQPVTVQAGRAPKGLEGQVFAWNTFQYTTTERNEKEEKKGDLHEGQLHRANRAAQGGPSPSMGYENRPASYGSGNGGTRGGRGGRGSKRGGAIVVGASGQQPDALCAGRKPAGNAPPLAKGFAEELDKSLFWDEPIC
ncbi:hypothetical protein OPT61_g1541 [Boeremia exigua]|uniref:Uncharacterized protein n=1 Tax=Boeremia exigua TaxID=749465 RepID=A0ACC2IPT2_9PLEO|nr:hypothetical protein OPT61_g1541 [Boeremia exigua]